MVNVLFDYESKKNGNQKSNGSKKDICDITVTQIKTHNPEMKFTLINIKFKSIF